MSDTLRKLKDDAAKLLDKGRGAEAADALVKVLREDPRDLAARQKLADLYVRLGRRREAIAEYQNIAGAYAAEGVLLKAIAVCKVILQLDPDHRETQSILADLSTRRQGGDPAVQIPASMSGAVRGPSRYEPPDLKRTPQAAAREKARNLIAAATAFARPSMLKPDDPLTIAVRAAALASVNKRRPAAPVPRPSSVSAAPAASAPPLEAAVPPEATGQAEETVQLAAGYGSAPASRGTPILIGVGAIAPATSASAAEAPPAPVASSPAAQAADAAAPTRVDVGTVPPIPLFSELPRDAFIALTERMTLRQAARGEVIIREGESGASMFIVIQGRITVTRAALDGSGDVMLAELEDGAFVGEIALLADTPRMATVTCAEDTLLFEVTRQVIDAIADEYPSVHAAMNRFHKSRLLASLMATSPIFAPFSPEERKPILEKFKLRCVEKGVALLTQATPGDGLYVVLSGRCEVLDRGADGKTTPIAELREGDVFGEMSMLWKNNVSASVVSKTPCMVLRLPEAAFTQLITTHPQVSKNLTDLAAARQRSNRELLELPMSDFIV